MGNIQGTRGLGWAQTCALVSSLGVLPKVYPNVPLTVAIPSTSLAGSWAFFPSQPTLSFR